MLNDRFTKLDTADHDQPASADLLSIDVVEPRMFRICGFRASIVHEGGRCRELPGSSEEFHMSKMRSSYA